MTALALVGFVLIALAVTTRFAAVRRASAADAWTPRIRDDRTLAGALQKLAKKHGQPAMAAALVRGGEIVARAAALDAAFVAVTATGGGAPAISEAIRKVTGLDWQ